MKQSRTTYLLIVIIATAVVSLLIYQQIRRHTAVQKDKATIENIKNEITELKELGFKEDEPAIKRLSERLQEVHNQLEHVEKSWFNNNARKSSPLQTHLEGLIALHTKMLESYQRDLHDYRKFGMKAESAIVQFTRKQIVRIKKKLAKLQNNLQTAQSDTKVMQVKLASLHALCQKAITAYKAELRGLLANGGTTQGPRLAHLKARLNDKIRLACEIDRLSNS